MLTRDGRGIKILCRVGEWIFGQESKNLNEVATRLKSYGISEGYAYKIIRWVEDTLIKSKLFSLPGRKALLKSDVKYEVVLVDASETPIQRPKKNSVTFTQAKRKNIR